MEVTNRFKGLDLIRVSEELWTEVHDIVQETEIKTIPKKKKCKKAKWLSEEALKIAEKRRVAKGKRYISIYVIPRSNTFTPGGSGVKNLPANTGDTGLIPGLGRSPGEGNSNLLQYSCLENPLGRGAGQATVHGVAKELDTT